MRTVSFKLKIFLTPQDVGAFDGYFLRHWSYSCQLLSSVGEARRFEAVLTDRTQLNYYRDTATWKKKKTLDRRTWCDKTWRVWRCFNAICSNTLASQNGKRRTKRALVDLLLVRSTLKLKLSVCTLQLIWHFASQTIGAWSPKKRKVQLSKYLRSSLCLLASTVWTSFTPF